MADPRTTGPQTRNANHSPLMKALTAASQGEPVNFCPHGCTTEELDDNGYCRHLVGFTKDKKTMEPYVTVTKTLADEQGEEYTTTRRFVRGSTPEPCLKGDKFEQITDTYRVYRDVDKVASAEKTPAK